MSPILLIGVLLFVGFLGGETARKLRLPKVTGFILAGVLLNPGVLGWVPADFTARTDFVTNVALSFITFSVGGTLRLSRIRRFGKDIVIITLCEAELAFLGVVLGILAVAPWLIHAPDAGWTATYIPVALLMGCLASPTDPSATLAVVHEYKAKGPVTSTILGVTAFDDALGIINYSIATALSVMLISHQRPEVVSAVFSPVGQILGAVLLGAAFGFAFNVLIRLVGREGEGVLIVIVLASLSTCFGVAHRLGVDELLATMSMGVVVVNFSSLREKVFKVLERYTEELIFVLFFTLSGMHLNLSVFLANLPLVAVFILSRAFGKIAGAVTGAMLASAPAKVKRYVAGGLIPQGGIAIGLALLMQQNPSLAPLAKTVISVIIGATVVHETLGPILSKAAIHAAGEITPRS